MSWINIFNLFKNGFINQFNSKTTDFGDRKTTKKAA